MKPMRRTEFSSGGNPCPRRLFPFPFQEHVMMNPRSSSCTLDGSIGASSAVFLLSGCSFSAGGHRGRAETDDDNERLLRGLCRLPHSSQLDRNNRKQMGWVSSRLHATLGLACFGIYLPPPPLFFTLFLAFLVFVSCVSRYDGSHLPHGY